MKAVKTSARLRAPFPWFGGKSRAADLIWSRLGNVPNYVEPFAGSLAIPLARPHRPRSEILNDRDCYLSNFWRAVTEDPAGVARWADWPVNEADLHARHLWLVNRQDFRERMMTDPDYYNVKIAGWWVWGQCMWIGGGWCARGGNWRKRPNFNRGGRGVHHSRPSLCSGGVGVHRKIVDLRRSGHGVHGVHCRRQLPSLGGDGSGSGRGILRWGMSGCIEEWFEQLAARLRPARIVCGDWKRVLGPSPTTHIGLTGIVLDPPYGKAAGRDPEIYTFDDLHVSESVRQWAVERGDNPKLRIALCGYDGEHRMPRGWECVAWKANGGYANQTRNRNPHRERIWFSPHCLKPN